MYSCHLCFLVSPEHRVRPGVRMSQAGIHHCGASYTLKVFEARKGHADPSPGHHIMLTHVAWFPAPPHAPPTPSTICILVHITIHNSPEHVIRNNSLLMPGPNGPTRKNLNKFKRQRPIPLWRFVKLGIFVFVLGKCCSYVLLCMVFKKTS